jgi:hypothetical protein
LGAAQDCTAQLPATYTGATCTYWLGRLRGAFDGGFEVFDGTPASFTVPTTTLDLPAVRLAVRGTITYTGGVRSIP